MTISPHEEAIREKIDNEVLEDGGVELTSIPKQDLDDLEEAYEQSLIRIEQIDNELVLAKNKIEEFQRTGWNPERAVKLRRLETFYSRFTAVMINSDKVTPLESLIKLQEIARQELSHLPETPWRDICSGDSSDG